MYKRMLSAGGAIRVIFTSTSRLYRPSIIDDHTVFPVLQTYSLLSNLKNLTTLRLENGGDINTDQGLGEALAQIKRHVLYSTCHDPKSILTHPQIINILLSCLTL